ncbi:MAG TPA: hypothetical protein VMI75_30405 [Polyangiaceae bacterium]|nr:hypothetical protein [Polyangiaceae bacterium]
MGVHQIPLSIVLVSIVVPMMLSGTKRPKQAIKILYVSIAIAAFVWCMLCLHVYPQYVLPEH